MRLLYSIQLQIIEGIIITILGFDVSIQIRKNKMARINNMPFAYVTAKEMSILSYLKGYQKSIRNEIMLCRSS